MAEDNSVTARFVLGLAIVAGIYMFWKMFIRRESLATKLEKRGYGNDVIQPIGAPDVATQLQDHKRDQKMLEQHNAVNNTSPSDEAIKPPVIARLEKTAEELKQDPNHQRIASVRMSLGEQHKKINEVIANAGGGGGDLAEGDEGDWDD
ncbi:hypothetical protein EhV347 [Emiliania huxleyi virus 86]|uniref:Putative membrane protein n=2 Tax=Emiliania huxleyi virus 86 TaxID=181082 RepID=Q4A2D2_EHV8U|nr:hypothetical protein EhV347 [Emiliania huxleyi virus 86]AEO97795.1 hypothetical protein ENVG_00262 [Emiliania huxleyi virus 84]AHA54953.1 putative membrane protein [Emiliania huxleyi virus 145]AHA55965.1 putative membrane protein [Emiliania huxleyi virus 164]UKZ11370.1 hypothetical protein EhVM1_000355 [Emiliania huxleyi virus M1]CAI65774.1 putative membrane protein [Emiliania huxleyi virus 86]